MHVGVADIHTIRISPFLAALFVQDKRNPTGAHPANFKEGGSKNTRSRSQERIQKILVGGDEISNWVEC